MAESKRTFQGARMDKDIDDRLLPAGSYRDALNVSVDFSEDGDVGALENLKGNETVIITFPSYLDANTNIGVKVVGSIPHPEENKFYYFFTGASTDGIVEYDKTAGEINPIILDSTEFVQETVLQRFLFSDAGATGTITVNGRISLQATAGVITSVTENFEETVTVTTTRTISAKVLVPDGYLNSGQYIFGEIEIDQPALGDPNVFLRRITNLTDTSVTLNAYYTANPGLTNIGFKYIANTGGSESPSTFANSFTVTQEDLYGRVATLIEDRNAPNNFFGIDDSDLSVVDSSGTSLTSSNFSIETFENNRPANIIFDDTYDPSSNDFYVVGQTSTALGNTSGRSETYVRNSATNVPVTPITAEFKADITGLTPDTEYVFLAYATNSSTTTYTPLAYFKTNTDSISLPTFSSSTATAGTSLVTFGATPNSNGGDSGATLYVVSNEESSNTIADYKTAAYTLVGGGSVSGYTLSTVGSWSSGVAQNVSVSTTGGNYNKGLVFAKNSSTLQNGGDNAGYTFDTAFVQATANSPAVNGVSSFSGSQSGPTGTVSPSSTLSWSITGTTTVTTVASGPGANTGLHADVTGTSTPGSNWATPSPSSVSTTNGTASWSASTTTTAPSSPGTYNWTMKVFYDDIVSSSGTQTGSYTVSSPPATSGTFTLAGNFIIGPYAGQTYGGSNGTGLLFSGNIPSAISVGSVITITGGGASNNIVVTTMTGGASSSFIGYTLQAGSSGGVFYGQGSTVNWSV